VNPYDVEQIEDEPDFYAAEEAEDWECYEWLATLGPEDFV
jgi:hypothetical protein